MRKAIQCKNFLFTHFHCAASKTRVHPDRKAEQGLAVTTLTTIKMIVAVIDVDRSVGRDATPGASICPVSKFNDQGPGNAGFARAKVV